MANVTDPDSTYLTQGAREGGGVAKKGAGACRPTKKELHIANQHHSQGAWCRERNAEGRVERYKEHSVGDMGVPCREHGEGSVVEKVRWREHGAWCMEHGAGSVVQGTWCMEHGAWSMVQGAWCRERGAGRSNSLHIAKGHTPAP